MMHSSRAVNILQEAEVADWCFLSRVCRGDKGKSVDAFSSCKRMVLGGRKLDLCSLEAMRAHVMLLGRIEAHGAPALAPSPSVDGGTSKQRELNASSTTLEDEEENALALDWQSLYDVIQTHIQSQQRIRRRITNSRLASLGPCVMAFPLEAPTHAHAHTHPRDLLSTLDLLLKGVGDDAPGGVPVPLLTACGGSRGSGSVPLLLYHISQLIVQGQDAVPFDIPALLKLMLQITLTALRPETAPDGTSTYTYTYTLDIVNTLSWAAAALLLREQKLSQLTDLHTHLMPVSVSMLVLAEHLAVLAYAYAYAGTREPEDAWLLTCMTCSNSSSSSSDHMKPAWRALSGISLGVRGLFPALILAHHLARQFHRIADVLKAESDEERSCLVYEAMHALRLVGRADVPLMLAILRAAWTSVHEESDEVHSAALLVAELLIHWTSTPPGTALQGITFAAALPLQRQHIQQNMNWYTAADTGTCLCRLSCALLLRLLTNAATTHIAAAWVTSLLKRDGRMQCNALIVHAASALPLMGAHARAGVETLLNLCRPYVCATASNDYNSNSDNADNCTRASANALRLLDEKARALSKDLPECSLIAAEATRLSATSSLSAHGSAALLVLTACPTRQGAHALAQALAAGHQLGDSYLKQDASAFRAALAAIQPVDGLTMLRRGHRQSASAIPSARKVARLPLEMVILTGCSGSSSSDSTSTTVPHFSPLSLDLALSTIANASVASFGTDLCSLTAACLHVYATRFSQHGPSADAAQLLLVLSRHRVLLVKAVLVHAVQHALDVLHRKINTTTNTTTTTTSDTNEYESAKVTLASSVSLLDMLSRKGEEEDEKVCDAAVNSCEPLALWTARDSIPDFVRALEQNALTPTRELLAKWKQRRQLTVEDSPGSVNQNCQNCHDTGRVAKRAYEGNEASSSPRSQDLTVLAVSVSSPSPPSPSPSPVSTPSKASRRGLSALGQVVRSSSRRGRGDWQMSPVVQTVQAPRRTQPVTGEAHMQVQQKAAVVNASQVQVCDLGFSFSLERTVTRARGRGSQGSRGAKKSRAVATAHMTDTAPKQLTCCDSSSNCNAKVKQSAVWGGTKGSTTGLIDGSAIAAKFSVGF